MCVIYLDHQPLKTPEDSTFDAKGKATGLEDFADNKQLSIPYSNQKRTGFLDIFFSPPLPIQLLITFRKSYFCTHNTLWWHMKRGSVLKHLDCKRAESGGEAIHAHILKCRTRHGHDFGL